MKSGLAAIRTLVLPYGATHGPYIILDGVNGVVLVYDENDDLIGALSGTTGADPDGNGYSPGLIVNPQGPTDPDSYTDTQIHLDPTVGAIAFWPNPNNPASGMFDTAGAVQVINNTHLTGSGPEFQLRTPTVFNNVGMVFTMRGVSRDGVETLLTLLRSESTDDTRNNLHRFLIGGTLYKQTSSGSGTWNTEEWTTAALAVNWVHLGEPVQYKLHPDGVVRLRGGAFHTPGTPGAGTTVFTLPANYRPNANRLFPIAHWGASGMGRITISPAGVVQIYDAPNNQPAFDPVSFSVAS